MPRGEVYSLLDVSYPAGFEVLPSFFRLLVYSFDRPSGHWQPPVTIKIYTIYEIISLPHRSTGSVSCLT